MKQLFYVICGLLFTMTACKTTQTTINIPIGEEERMLDTLIVEAPVMPKPTEMTAEEEVALAPEDYKRPTFNASQPLKHDLLHTKLAIRFDWAKEQVIGQATLRMTPYFYPTNTVTLDAKNFEFKKVAFDAKGDNLKYEYDGQELTVNLGKEFTRKDTFQLFIDYVATPSAEGGSAAITSDKGLFFINPTGEEDKPQQIWTQGETEHNSKWFPTFDQPNERCTQEIILTVQDKYKTLSNGLLVESTKNEDGTRTDYWKMDQPHAPYLFMVTVGDFSVVQDRWEDIPLAYYVEPEYKEVARDIFPYTPDMLGFFSKKLDVKYPWQKYSQVVVRDYVSGAMENTTAVIFGDFMQGQKEDLVDVLTNEKIVAHEMFHHWFGDYVTCESWANLTMNEGFANYSEYLWLEHKHGREEADYHLQSELQTYISQATTSGAHPLIYYGYNDKEDMFDAHSYNKGGLVLHALRNYVGDDAFWAALNVYLTKNAYSAVEADELRLAFEDVTGQDMIWFFDQWYHKEGHPELEVQYTYDETSDMIVLTVEQKQDPDQYPAIFQLPLQVDIYADNGQKASYDIMVNERLQEFTFDVAAPPALVNFDANRILLGVVNYEKSEEELIFQYENAPLFLDRYEALVGLANMEAPSAAAEQTLRKALEDKFYALRSFAVNEILELDEQTQAQVIKIATTDSKAPTRVAALGQLIATGDMQFAPTLEKVMNDDPAAMVKGQAMVGLGMLYAESADIDKLSFFEENWQKLNYYDAINFFEGYSVLANTGNEENQLAAATNLSEVALNNESFWRRGGATIALNSIYQSLKEKGTMEAASAVTEAVEKVKDMLSTILETEKNQNLLQVYSSMISL